MLKLINDQFIAGKSPPEIIIAISGSGMKYSSALLRKLMVTVKSAFRKNVECNLYKRLCCLEVIAVVFEPKDNCGYDNYSYCFSRLPIMFANELLWTDGEK